MGNKRIVNVWGIYHLAVAAAAAAVAIVAFYLRWNWLCMAAALIVNLYLVLMMVEAAMRRKSTSVTNRWLVEVPLAIYSLPVVALLTIAIVTAFAGMYLASQGVIDSNFSAQRAVLDDRWDAIYFSTVTFATLGYGDFVPVTRAARLLVVWQLATTVLFLLGILPLLISRLADFDLRNQPPG
jgi:hypothetical protein